ncbi:glycosyltransferase [Inhella sp.]|uniref:glycosyltransferase n=1 Tax=Inhella sp. TaxID=1921806 RepID=UPI0035AFA85A
MARVERVLHLISGLGQGGAETALERLLHSARAQNPEIAQEVLSLGGLGPVGERLRAAGFSVQSLGLSGRRPWRLLGLWSWLRARRQGALLQTWMYHADLLGALLARPAGIRRLVWNVRQTGLGATDIRPGTRLVVRLCAWLSGRPAAIVTNARSALTVHAAQGYRAACFHWIPNGFDTQTFRPDAQARQALRREWGVADDELLVGLVARLDPQKDHANFLQAAARLHQAWPAARFVLVGSGIPQDAALGAEIARLKLPVLRLDNRADIPAVLSALDLFCLSSRAEGFPNVLGEAMACARACVSTRCGDAAELLPPECLAPPQDPEALAQALLRWAQAGAAARQALGERLRAKVQAEFPQQAVWPRYLALYESL